MIFRRGMKVLYKHFFVKFNKKNFTVVCRIYNIQINLGLIYSCSPQIQMCTCTFLACLPLVALEVAKECKSLK